MVGLKTAVNQRLPSGPAVILSGHLKDEVSGNSVTVPTGVIRPILFDRASVNQRLPSGPRVIPAESVYPSGALGTGNVVMIPLGVMRPIRIASPNINQRLPSGPAVIASGGPKAMVGRRKSVMVTVGSGVAVAVGFA
jgi:hypothetical protein